jgi:FtsP/CotA-like multicopper oxidase with cupredoxin domain
MDDRVNQLRFTRRQFIRTAGVVGAGAGLTAACATLTTPTPAPEASGAAATDQMGMETAPVAQAEPDYQVIDAAHKAQVDKFLANIGKDDKFWGVELPFTMDGDTKVFELTCQNVDWEVEPGKVIKNAYTYDGIVPGPVIRVTEGDKVRVNVKNDMQLSTSIHWHGVLTPNKMDGVPYVTQEPITPGSTFVYEFVAKNPGSHMYHSHHDAAEQVTKGMMAAFIIEPKDKSKDPTYDQEYIIVLNDTGIGLTINGKSFPYTQPLTAKLGQKLRVRYMNEGLLIHPMHLHGIPQLVFSKDGYNLASPYWADTLNIAPGERYDVIVDCNEPGLWAYHCHILTHAESARGMFGMVTVLVIE